MKERRKVERFNLRVKTRVSLQIKDNEAENQIYWSRDISSAGVFLSTDQVLPIGTEANLDLFLPSEFDDNSKGKEIMLNLSGTVVRTNEQGMAVSFNPRYRISQLGG